MIGYGVGRAYIDDKYRPVHVTSYKRRGRVVAQHLRFIDDNGIKDFRWRGKPQGIELYGQDLWNARGKKLLVITEGEKDMASFVEATNGIWACMSVPNGASNAAKDIKPQLEQLNEYDKIILLFDMDEAGQAAAEECVALFPAGRCGIGVLPDGYKDANEMLLAGEGDALKWIPWKTKPWEPDEITGGDDLLDEILNVPDKESIPFPWPKLQRMTLGARVGEIITIGGGTGTGKSEIVRQLAFAFRMNEDEKIGYIALEESARTSALDFMGLDMGLRLRLRRHEFDDEQLTAAYRKVIGGAGNEHIRFYKHFGSLESSKLINRIRFMVQGCDCTTIVLDHISIAVSGNESNNERKDIDVLMTNLRSLVEELGIRCLLVSHLKRPKDGSHEEGGRVHSNDFRGSGSIAQISDIVIGAERNQQSTTNSNQVTLRIVKNRWTGIQGVADVLEYDHVTGRLSPSTAAAKKEFDNQPNGEPDF
jgi:twinkle protein